MNITVILCTFNRAGILSKALQSLVSSTLPETVEWEILVVDNNSTDDTRSVVEDFCRRHPGLCRYTLESHPGKSFALNRGIREARGDVLVFTDDDVTVEPIWLQNLTSGLIAGEWAGAGGRTRLAHPFSPPRWLSLKEPYNLGSVLSGLFDMGDEPCELSLPPYGNNMAFRKEMFGKYGLFRTDLGPSPLSEIPRPSEDTEFGRRLMMAGERLRYEPSAVVYHPVPPDRVRKDYFLSWFFDYGRAMVRQWPRGPNILGVPRRCFTFLKIVGAVIPLRALLWVAAWNPWRRFFWKCWLWVSVGNAWEICQQWQKGRGKPAIQATATDRECGIERL